MKPSTFTIALLAVFAISNSFAHTWVGCVNQQGSTCKGYIRNYVGRNTPTTDVDGYYTWKALGRPNDFPLCKTDTQANRIYNAQYPMASANAGETLNIMYTPNGHSQAGDHGLLTTARIHWTGSTTQTLNTRADLSSSNQLTSWPYGQNCATTGDVASLPCVNGFTIPATTPTGVYQFVWYWPYDKNQQQVPIGEEYFSCFDVNVTSTTYVAPTSQQATTAKPSSSQEVTTSNQASPSTSASQGSDSCATSMADCQSFCAPAAATVCDCDPTTGKKTVQCGGVGDDEETSGALRNIVGLSLIFAISQLI